MIALLIVWIVFGGIFLYALLAFMVAKLSTQTGFDDITPKAVGFAWPVMLPVMLAWLVVRTIDPEGKDPNP